MVNDSSNGATHVVVSDGPGERHRCRRRAPRQDRIDWLTSKRAGHGAKGHWLVRSHVQPRQNEPPRGVPGSPVPMSARRGKVQARCS